MDNQDDAEPAQNGASRFVNGLMALVQDRLTQVGALITALLAVNTGLTSCADNNIQRYKAFDEAYHAEEAFWRGLYKDYLEAIDASQDGQDAEVKVALKKLREQKLAAIQALAQKDVSNFAEFKLGYFYQDTARQNAAVTYFENLKANLNKGINGADSGGEYVIASNFKNAEAEDVRLRNAAGQLIAPVPEETSAVDTPLTTTGPELNPGKLTYETKVLSYGGTTGYDLDVFWCAEGPREAINFNLASAAAQKLLALSKAKQALGGQPIGRIRLRALPADKQGNGYPDASSGNQIRYDASELGVAQDIERRLSSSGVSGFVAKQSNMNTKWYISLFVCGPAQSNAT